MSPKGRSKKSTKTNISTDDTTVDVPADFPYTVGDTRKDVKIVEIKSKVERCIGFVYAKRGNILNSKGRVVNSNGILLNQWEEYVHWMTLSDFKNQFEG